MSVASIKSALAKLKDLPAAVDSWEVELGPDASGDYAAWVWVILKDENSTHEARNKIRERVREEVMRAEDSKPTWVYVRFRTASEVAELESA